MQLKKINFIKKIFYLIYFFILISLIVYLLSFASIINGKVYDFFWINSIQKRLYWGGLIRAFPCYKYNKQMAYVPKEGKCNWKNIEFDTTLKFTKYFRQNDSFNNYENKEIIAVLGDSFSMGWGVNDNQTFSSILEKKLNQKVLNFGVSGYGTHQEILRFINSPYTEKVDKIIIQYHMNDLQTNLDFEKKAGIFSENFVNKYFVNIEEHNSINKIYFALRHYKSSFRLLYRDIKSLFVKSDKPDFKIHYEKFLNILESYSFFENKKIIFFYVNGYNLEFKNYEEKKYKNIEFVKVNLEKKENYFIIDEHLNSQGHLDLANQLFKIIKNKANW